MLSTNFTNGPRINVLYAFKHDTRTQDTYALVVIEKQNSYLNYVYLAKLSKTCISVFFYLTHLVSMITPFLHQCLTYCFVQIRCLEYTKMLRIRLLSIFTIKTPWALAALALLCLTNVL